MSKDLITKLSNLKLKESSLKRCLDKNCFNSRGKARVFKELEKRGYDAKTVYTKVDYKPTDILKDNNKQWDLIVCCGGDRNIK